MPSLTLSVFGDVTGAVTAEAQDKRRGR